MKRVSINTLTNIDIGCLTTPIALIITGPVSYSFLPSSSGTGG